jgi:hypothetical protein
VVGLGRSAGQNESCDRIVFAVCCEERETSCVSVTPVPELARVLDADAESYRDQRVVLVGVFDPEFQFWDFQVMAQFAKGGRGGRDSGLRALVAAAGRADNRTVRVRGRFRGRNLFGDLPAGSQRGSGDWVIQDQGVAVWVTGKPPRGEGWKLDLESESESVRWVEVEGEPTAHDGVIYLRARSVALVSGPIAREAPPDR